MECIQSEPCPGGACLFQVSFADPDSPYYCKRNVYVVCSVLAIVMVLGGLLALVIFSWIRIVDTRRRKRNNNSRVKEP